jgi:hypothetical protein
MKAKDVKVGLVFKITTENRLLGETLFIKLIDDKVVNTASWTTARVDPETLVEIVGKLQLNKE